MAWMIRLTVILSIFLVCISSRLRAGESFLLKPPVTTTFKWPANYSDRMKELSAAIEKRIIPPDGVAEFADQVAQWKIGSFFCTGSGLETKNFAKRKLLLDQATSSLGMTWRYDALNDCILLDFSWRHEVPRTSTQLMDALLHPEAVVGSKVNAAGTSYFISSVSDSRPIILDALLGKPENFRAAWKVRFAEDLKCFPFSSRLNLLTMKMKDQSVHKHVLALNAQPSGMNPGEGTISYYVFDTEGHFEQGGMFGGGWRCHDESAWLDSSGKKLTLRAFFNYRNKMDRDFILTQDGLVLQSATDDRSPITPENYGGYHFGDAPLHVSQ